MSRKLISESDQPPMIQRVYGIDENALGILRVYGSAHKHLEEMYISEQLGEATLGIVDSAVWIKDETGIREILPSHLIPHLIEAFVRDFPNLEENSTALFGTNTI